MPTIVGTPAVEQDMTAFQKGMNNNGWIGSNFTLTNPLNQISALGNSSIVKGVKSLGSGFVDGLKSLTHSQSQQDVIKYGDNQSMTMNNVYDFAVNHGYNGTLSDFRNDTEARNAYGNLAVANQTGDLSSSGTWGTEFKNSFNLGQTLGSAQNLLNLGTAGWGLYANVQNYKQNKDLLNKQKEYLQQAIDNNRENMEFVRKERARQDTMRSNVSAQRSSSSSVRSF